MGKLLYGILFLSLAAIIAFIGSYYSIMGNYVWERDYFCHWALAEKASSIPAKQQELEKFWELLKTGNSKGVFAANDAVFLKTQNNSFDSNLLALESLVTRLNEIIKMNPTSFEYNTAIQQITAQEQGEAHAMLNVFKGCYMLQNYPLSWAWIRQSIFWIVFVLGFAGLFLVLPRISRARRSGKTPADRRLKSKIIP